MAEQISPIAEEPVAEEPVAEEPEVNKDLPPLVQQYLWKTGHFHPQKGNYAGWSADDIMKAIENDDRFSQDIKDHFTLFRKKEGATLHQGKGEVAAGIEEVWRHTKDQYKGLMYGFYQIPNSLHKETTGEDILPAPVTPGGEVAQIAGQVGSSFLAGNLVAKTVSAILPTVFIKRTPQFLSNVLSRIKGGDKIINKTKKVTEGLTGSRKILDPTKKSGLQVVETKQAIEPLIEAAKVGIGETLTLPKDYRTTRMIADLFGIEEGPIYSLSGIEDKGLFQEKWDGFIDGTLTYMGGTALLPVLKIFGTKLWETGAFATNEVLKNELVEPAFNYLKKELKRIGKDFKDLYPEKIISEKEAAVIVDNKITKMLNRHKGQLKRAETLKAKKGGKDPEIVESDPKATKKIKNEIKELQSKFKGLEENKIDWEELIKNPIDFEKVRGELNLKLINDETDVIKLLEIVNNKIRGQSKSVTIAEMNAASEKLIESLKGLKVDPIKLINTIGTQAHDLAPQLLAAQTLLISQGRRFIEVSKKVNNKRIKTLLLKEELGSVPQANKMEEILTQASEAGIEKATKAELMEVLEEYLRLRHIHKVVNGANSDTGLALRVLQEVKTGDIDMNTLFKQLGVSIEKVAAESDGHNWEQAIEAMAEQVANYTNPSQAVSHSVGGSFWYDTFQIMNMKNINALLSTPSTWAVNFAGTGVMNALITTEKYIAAMYTKLQKELGIPVDGAVTFDEANKYAYGKVQALLEGLWHTEQEISKRSAFGEGIEAFKTGSNKKGISALDHELTQQGLNISNQRLGGWGVPDPISSGIVNKYLSKVDPKYKLRDGGALSNLINSASIFMSVPGRTLLSQDAIYRNLEFRGVIHEHVRRRAKQLAGPNATEEAIDAHYRELIVNIPEDIHNIANIEASISVFQERLKDTGWHNPIETAIFYLEKLRNTKIDPQIKNKWIQDGFVPNALSSFMLSVLPFVRTPYNIMKQGFIRSPLMAGVEVGSITKDALKGVPNSIGKTVNTGANVFRSKGKEKIYVGKNPFKTNKFLNDHKYRSDSLARLTLGSTLFGSGYWFTKESTKNGIIIDDKKYSVELSKKNVSERDIDQEEGIIPPAIIQENLIDGKFQVLNARRADPGIQTLTAGAIFGAYDEFVKEIKSLESENIIVEDQAEELLEELEAVMMYQIGTLFYEKSSLQGVKNLLMDSGATGHPYADPGRVMSQFLATWIGQTPFSGFTSGLHRSIVNKKYYNLSRQKRKLVEKENPDEGEWIKGFDGIEIPLYETLENGDIRPYSREKIDALRTWERAMNAWIDTMRKTYILDPTLDIADYFNNGGESPIRRGACQMFDLEGNNKGFSVQEADVFQRVYEQMLSPLSWKKVQKTNTSTLIRKLDINFPHPKRWLNAPVAKTQKSVPIDPTMQCHWGLNYGLKNREVFNTPKFNTIVHILENKKIKDIPTTNLKVPIIGDNNKIKYKSVPKFTPIKEVLNNYELFIDEKTNTAYFSDPSIFAIQQEVLGLLKTNRQLSWLELKSEPAFGSLQGKMKEISITENSKIKQMQSIPQMNQTPDNLTQLNN